MPSETKKENVFNIEVSIPEINFNTKKVNLFYIFRFPFVKPASYAGLDVAMGQIGHYNKLMDLFQNNKMPSIKIDIWYADSATVDGNPRNYKNTTRFMQKEYKLIKIGMVDNEIKNSNQMITARLLLVNPILYDLSRSNGFNIVSDPKRAKDVLKEFEGYLAGQYPKSFQFKGVGDTENENDFIYKQGIQISQDNDLKVPNLLLYNKKALNSLAYYFMDDFRSSKGKIADICGLTINLSNPDVFEQLDIMDCEKNPDANNFKLKKVEAQFNHNSSIQKDGIIIFRDPEGRDERYPPVKGEQPTSTLEPVNVELNNSGKGRSIVASTQTEIQKIKPDSKIINIACEDTDIAKKRFEIVKKQMKTTIKGYQELDIANCYPDLFEFDRRYNLDPGARSEYQFIPISICNIFRMDAQKKQLMTHGAKVKFIIISTS